MSSGLVHFGVAEGGSTTAIAAMAAAVVVAVAAALIILYLLFAFRTSGDKTSRKSGFVSASRRLTAGQWSLLHCLVEEIAPQVLGTSFDKDTIDRLLADARPREGVAWTAADFDQVLYYRFRQQLHSGRLSVSHLSTAITSA